VTGTAGNDVSKTATASFILTIKNPCIDPNYVTIQTKPLNDQNYDLYDLAPNGLQWIHDAFVLNTLPFSHTLCGGFTYKATFKDTAISASSSPMKYETATRTYSFYSEDFGLLGP